MHDAKYIGP
jgi:hypothetical protein